MARLPEPGRDTGQWGEILNDFLLQSLKSDGSLKENLIATANLQNGSVTAEKLANSILGEVIESATLVNNHLIFTTHDGTQIDVGDVKGAKGDTGEIGPQGPTGETGEIGATGPANSLNIGTVTKLAAGATPSASITGAAPSQTLALSLVTGDTGAKGDTGDQIPYYSGGAAWSGGTISLDTYPFPSETQRTLSGNVTLTLSDRVAGSTTGTLGLVIVQGIAGGWTVTWPANVKWPYGIKPVIPIGPGIMSEYRLEWSGNAWLAKVAGPEYA